MHLFRLESGRLTYVGSNPYILPYIGPGRPAEGHDVLHTEYQLTPAPEPRGIVLIHIIGASSGDATSTSRLTPYCVWGTPTDKLTVAGGVLVACDSPSVARVNAKQFYRRNGETAHRQLLETVRIDNSVGVCMLADGTGPGSDRIVLAARSTLSPKLFVERPDVAPEPIWKPTKRLARSVMMQLWTEANYRDWDTLRSFVEHTTPDDVEAWVTRDVAPTDRGIPFRWTREVWEQTFETVEGCTWLTPAACEVVAKWERHENRKEECVSTVMKW